MIASRGFREQTKLAILSDLPIISRIYSGFTFVAPRTLGIHSILRRKRQRRLVDPQWMLRPLLKSKL